MSPAPHQKLLTVQINAISRAISELAASKVAPIGINPRMISVMFAADELDHPSQQDIAVHTGIDRTTVSKTIDHLEVEGLVLRHIDPRHRRRHWIQLTAKAQRTLAQVHRAFAACDADFLSPLSTIERDQLTRILHKLAPDTRS